MTLIVQNSKQQQQTTQSTRRRRTLSRKDGSFPSSIRIQWNLRSRTKTGGRKQVRKCKNCPSRCSSVTLCVRYDIIHILKTSFPLFLIVVVLYTPPPPPLFICLCKNNTGICASVSCAACAHWKQFSATSSPFFHNLLLLCHVDECV